MVLAREDIDFENLKREADVEMLVKNMVQANNMIAHLKDEQFEMRDELKRQEETISKLEDDARKDKRWNMFWRNHLDDNIDKTQIVLAIVFSINIIFAYLISH
ncbi:hypothetical protein [Leuconostoc suionicum]|uniref:hypothetical protein n=1 Tax=Leuconostoc suionicum TaxID=1511761 RepID=UPI001B8AA281|nr:hypothetical protein [Leuconostoc suionicum]MBS1007777.1 hypothetical protein [Leuconostoc suionicum]